MDYEKNNEVLAIVRRMVADGQVSQEVAEKYFPELAESEDLEIKSDIQYAVRCAYGDNSSKTERILAWLDKQGEQKPVAIPKFRVGDFVKDANYHGEPTYEIVGMDGECYICQYRGNKSMGDRSVMHFCFDNPYLRLVEQKPVDLVAILKDYFANTPKEQQDKDWEELKYLNNFGLEVVELEPAWGEYDCMMIESIIQTLEITGDKGANSMKINWLKDLKSRVQPQPRQEWSEEDKRSIRDSIFYLKSAKKYFEKDDDILWDEKWFNLCIEFLEALYKKLQPQPQWKPSDEQMDALEHFVRSIGESGYASPHDNNTKFVYSLLSDLKKLREE